MTRPRSVLAATSALVMALGLAGCGSGDDAPSASVAAPAADSATASPTAPAVPEGMRLVRHDKGETAVPVEPKRVVVLDSPQLDAALSLGVTPIGATRSGEDEGLPAYLSDQTAGVELVGTIESPNIEAVAALRPDLILSATVRHDELYDEFSAIAPTVYAAGSGTNWREGFALVAEALNRVEQGQAALADFDAQADRIGEAIGVAGRRASIVRFLPDETRIYGPSTFSGSVLSDVGFALPQLEYDEYSIAYISPEQVEQANADVVFSATYGDPEESTRGAVTALWGNLSAVRDGCQFDVEDGEWMIGIGLIGARKILADLDKALDPGRCGSSAAAPSAAPSSAPSESSSSSESEATPEASASS